jgi:hypothetical protein
MHTIEIKQNKKTLIPAISIFIVVIVLTTYFVFFTDKVGDNKIIKYGYIPLTIFMVYQLFGPIKKLLSDVSIITFSEESITLRTDKVIMIPKHEIQNIEVEYIDEKGFFLKIKSSKGDFETNVTWLDKSPEQIKELIKGYN